MGNKELENKSSGSSAENSAWYDEDEGSLSELSVSDFSISDSEEPPVEPVQECVNVKTLKSKDAEKIEDGASSKANRRLQASQADLKNKHSKTIKVTGTLMKEERKDSFIPEKELGMKIPLVQRDGCDAAMTPSQKESKWLYELTLSNFDILELNSESFRKLINLASDCAFSFKQPRGGKASESAVSLFFGDFGAMQFAMQKLGQVSFTLTDKINGVLIARQRMSHHNTKSNPTSLSHGKQRASNDVELSFTLHTAWTDKLKQLVQMKDWKKGDNSHQNFAKVAQMHYLVSKEIISLLFPFSIAIKYPNPQTSERQTKPINSSMIVEFSSRELMETVLCCFQGGSFTLPAASIFAYKICISNFKPSSLPTGHKSTNCKSAPKPPFPADHTRQGRLFPCKSMKDKACKSGKSSSQRGGHGTVQSLPSRGSNLKNQGGQSQSLRSGDTGNDRKRSAPVCDETILSSRKNSRFSQEGKNHQMPSVSDQSSRMKQTHAEKEPSDDACDGSLGDVRKIALDQGLDPNNSDVLCILQLQRQLQSMQCLIGASEDKASSQSGSLPLANSLSHPMTKSDVEPSLSLQENEFAEAERKLRESIATRQLQLKELEQKLQLNREKASNRCQDDSTSQVQDGSSLKGLQRAPPPPPNLNDEPLDFKKPQPKVEQAVKADELRSRTSSRVEPPPFKKPLPVTPQQPASKDEDCALPVQFGKHVGKVVPRVIKRKSASVTHSRWSDKEVKPERSLFGRGEDKNLKLGQERTSHDNPVRGRYGSDTSRSSTADSFSRLDSNTGRTGRSNAPNRGPSGVKQGDAMDFVRPSEGNRSRSTRGPEMDDCGSKSSERGIRFGSNTVKGKTDAYVKDGMKHPHREFGGQGYFKQGVDCRPVSGDKVGSQNRFERVEEQSWPEDQRGYSQVWQGREYQSAEGGSELWRVGKTVSKMDQRAEGQNSGSRDGVLSYGRLDHLEGHRRYHSPDSATFYGEESNRHDWDQNRREFNRQPDGDTSQRARGSFDSNNNRGTLRADHNLKSSEVFMPGEWTTAGQGDEVYRGGNRAIGQNRPIAKRSHATQEGRYGHEAAYNYDTAYGNLTEQQNFENSNPAKKNKLYDYHDVERRDQESDDWNRGHGFGENRGFGSEKVQDYDRHGQYSSEHVDWYAGGKQADYYAETDTQQSGAEHNRGRGSDWQQGKGVRGARGHMGVGTGGIAMQGREFGRGKGTDRENSHGGLGQIDAFGKTSRGRGQGVSVPGRGMLGMVDAERYDEGNFGFGTSTSFISREESGQSKGYNVGGRRDGGFDPTGRDKQLDKDFGTSFTREDRFAECGTVGGDESAFAYRGARTGRGHTVARGAGRGSAVATSYTGGGGGSRIGYADAHGRGAEEGQEWPHTEKRDIHGQCKPWSSGGQRGFAKTVGSGRGGRDAGSFGDGLLGSSPPHSGGGGITRGRGVHGPGGRDTGNARFGGGWASGSGGDGLLGPPPSHSVSNERAIGGQFTGDDGGAGGSKNAGKPYFQSSGSRGRGRGSMSSGVNFY